MLLSPSWKGKKLCNFIGYCLAYAAQLYGIQIHASVWMSNHHHTDVTDPHGNLVPFKQLLHSMIARGRNAQLPRHDSFWSGDEACDTRRPTDEQALGDLVYTLTNPVKDGLVKWSCLWPGFTTADWRFGETRTFKRPDWFFDARGQMPDEVTLTLVRPPIFKELDDDALYERLVTEVRAAELGFRQEFRARPANDSWGCASWRGNSGIAHRRSSRSDSRSRPRSRPRVNGWCLRSCSATENGSGNTRPRERCYVLESRRCFLRGRIG
jgi:hypothetical protein